MQFSSSPSNGPWHPPDLSWRGRAACRGLDPSIFYPNRDDLVAPAKAVCGACAVRLACLEHALAVREADGVWGGLTEGERRRLLRRRLRAV